MNFLTIIDKNEAESKCQCKEGKLYKRTGNYVDTKMPGWTPRKKYGLIWECPRCKKEFIFDEGSIRAI